MKELSAYFMLAACRYSQPYYTNKAHDYMARLVVTKEMARNRRLGSPRLKPAEKITVGFAANSLLVYTEISPNIISHAHFSGSWVRFAALTFE